MEFRDKRTGTIYHVINEKLVGYYEADENFEKVEKKPEKKTTTKK